MTASVTVAEALTPQPAGIDPQVEFAKLRAWVTDHACDTHPVRRAAVSMAMSAVAHRLLKFGPDASLDAMSARELIQLLMYTNGPLAEFLMRVIYFRALIEGDHPIYEHLNTTLFIPECRAWYWTIAEALMARAPNPDEVTTWLENMRGEEKSTARLIVARVYPDVAHIDWLHDLPDTTQPQLARLGAELCAILLENPLYVTAVRNFLRLHPHVRYAVGEDRWGKL